MQITLVYAPEARQMRQWMIDMPAGSTLAQALVQSGAMAELADLAEQLATGELTAGIWGRAAMPSQVLENGDRVELYRALRVDPKVARRERFKGQGSRGAGLFAKRRAGGKAGY
jgi:putative ubiquitin-RnfH superfamily antitoxin RatB of RatAB toxin-antitoxin module